MTTTDTALTVYEVRDSLWEIQEAALREAYGPERVIVDGPSVRIRRQCIEPDDEVSPDGHVYVDVTSALDELRDGELEEFDLYADCPADIVAWVRQRCDLDGVYSVDGRFAGELDPAYLEREHLAIEAQDAQAN